MFAEKSGYTEDFIKNNEEQMSKFQFNLYSWYTPSISERDISQVERLFHIEEKMINEIASKSSCVIVGRLANFILGDRDNTFHIFISSDADAKIRRIMGRDELSSEDAQKKKPWRWTGNVQLIAGILFIENGEKPITMT